MSVLLSFVKSDHTFIFVTLEKGLSCHRPGVKKLDSFSKSPYYYDDDHHIPGSLTHSVSFFFFKYLHASEYS